jgi:hypothetical protein
MGYCRLPLPAPLVRSAQMPDAWNAQGRKYFFFEKKKQKLLLVCSRLPSSTAAYGVADKK